MMASESIAPEIEPDRAGVCSVVFYGTEFLPAFLARSVVVAAAFLRALGLLLCRPIFEAHSDCLYPRVQVEDMNRRTLLDRCFAEVVKMVFPLADLAQMVTISLTKGCVRIATSHTRCAMLMPRPSRPFLRDVESR